MCVHAHKSPTSFRLDLCSSLEEGFPSYVLALGVKGYCGMLCEGRLQQLWNAACRHEILIVQSCTHGVIVHTYVFDRHLDA
jgi:hypothetical protein